MPASFEPFDFHRMFLGGAEGWLFLLEIVFRTCVMYIYALLFSRLIGQRGVGQVTPFEFIVVVIVSAAAGTPMLQANVPLLHGMIVLTTIMLIHWGLGFLSDRNQYIESTLESEPILVVDYGELVHEALTSKSLSYNELLMGLRLQGISNFGQVEKAYFEPCGQVSVIKVTPEQQQDSGSTLPIDVERTPK